MRVEGTADIDFLSGTGNDDEILGFAENDELDGGAGNDTLIGGAGDDTYIVDAAGDVVTELAGEGTDTVRTALATYTLGANVEILEGTDWGGSGQTLIGNSLDNRIFGSTNVDTLIGGAGNDTYVMRDEMQTITELANEGIDTIESEIAYWWLPTHFENFTGTSSDRQIINGNGVDNVIKMTGGGNDWILGHGGNDVLDGGAGQDSMQGGAGVDTYYVDHAYDTIIEEGFDLGDTVHSSLASYAITALVENLVGSLTTGQFLYGNREDNTITGNSGNDTLTGGFRGNDTLNGGDGDDTLRGGGDPSNNLDSSHGNDVYNGGDGIDTLTYMGGLENLSHAGEPNGITVTLTGSGSGTVVTNTILDMLEPSVTQLFTDTFTSIERIIGGGGADSMTGDAGNNNLDGAAGADTINGGAGADQMAGGNGADIFYVDNVGDVVTETEASVATGGFDIVIATANHTLGANVEQLVIQGAATHGTGGATDNVLYGIGNGNALTLSGGDGNDVMYGSTVGGNTMSGGSGVDTMLAYGGNNTLNGGAGSDIYFTYTSTDTISEMGGDGIETVYATYSINVGEDIEQVLISGAATSITSTSLDDNNIFYGNSATNAVTLSGGGGADVLIGGSNGDTLNGGAGVDLLFGNGGADTLVGGDDTDVYYLVNGSETIVEVSSGGFDTAYSQAVSTTLASNVEQLILHGAATSATGSAQGDYLYGHIASAAVTLDGAGGNDYLRDSAQSGDVLIGGAGNDQLDLRTGGSDVVRFASGSDADQVLGFDADATGGQDMIDVSGRGFSAASIGSAIVIAAAGSNTVVTIGADTMTLVGVSAVDVTASDFMF